MSTHSIAVTVLGSGEVADLISHRIQQRSDLSLEAVLPSAEEPSTGSACVVYLPTDSELAKNAAALRIVGLLKAGFNVVSTLPIEALNDVDILAACREGSSTFHGTGGFQSRLITRFNRAYAAITRNIRDVELVEELDVDDFDIASQWEGNYNSGLHTLSEAVFGEDIVNETLATSTIQNQGKSGVQQIRGRKEVMSEQVIVQRSLGSVVAYDSVWTKRKGSEVPLRYRFTTASDDAVGQVTISFNGEGNVQPTDYLTCVGLLDAIRPVHENAPGVLRNDLDINHVKPDDRLAR